MKENKSPLRSLVYNSMYGAVLLIVLGIYFLLHNFGVLPDSWDIGQLWPLLLIISGVVLLARRRKG